MRIIRYLLVVSIILGFTSLFLQYSVIIPPSLLWAPLAVDILVIAISFLETVMAIAAAKYRSIHIKRNLPSYIFLVVYLILFVVSRGFSMENASHGVLPLLLVIRNFFLSLRLYTRFTRIAAYIENILTHPSQSIIASFAFLVFFGTLMLMMPFTSASGNGLSFIDSLFTSTSAVCVTGLIVTDTATAFTIWGKIVILCLIQAGGLGIMILSFSALFFLGRKISYENKLLLSYMLNEEDITGLSAVLRRIVVTTFSVEALGAVILFRQFSMKGMETADSLFFAVFHSVSAFCNAGFALFSDSLEQFVGNGTVIMTIGVLIVAGGIGFSTFSQLLGFIPFPWRPYRPRLSLNSRIVLRYYTILIISGALLVYLLEHSGVLIGLGLKNQYLSALFQSITLRTAGFNSVPFSSLAAPTLIIMIIFMFIGGASGGTAGGIKVNSLAVILSYLKTLGNQEHHIIIRDHQISTEQVLKAFVILFIGLTAVFLSVIILSLTESMPFIDLLFESVSAFATVGLSTGITGHLSAAGRVVITALMFLGRLGPLTFIAASARHDNSTGYTVSYPEAQIQIG